MTVGEIKAQLNAVRETERRYRLAKDKYAAYRQLLIGGRAAGNNIGEPVRKTEKNFTEQAYCQLAGYEAEKDKMLDELVTARKRADKLIACVKDPTGREILTRKYLMCQRWEDIAQDMHYSSRRIFQLHRVALKNISVNFT